MVAQLEDLLLGEGFTALTMDDLAARLHCSKATLYGIAPSKEQLVLRVTKHFFQCSAEKVEAAVEKESDPRRRIATYINEIGRAMRRQSAAFYADMLAFPPAAEVYQANADLAARRVGELIDDGVRRGEFRALDGTFVARLVGLGIRGVQTGSLLEDGELTAGEALTQLADLVLHGLTSTGGATSSPARSATGPRS